MALILLDLETAPLENAAEFVDLHDLKAPSNYKDQAKIDAYLEDARAKALDTCALDPDLCRIVVVGTWRVDEAEARVDLATDGEMEAGLLREFWPQVGPRDVLVTFNGVEFDLRVLLRRSLYLGVHTPNIEVTKYRHRQVADVYAELTHDGDLARRFNGHRHTQDWYAKRFGYVEPDGPDISGADVPQAIGAGQWEAVREHCRRDLLRLRFLADRIGLFSADEVF